MNPVEPEYATVNEVNNLHADVRAVRSSVDDLIVDTHEGFRLINKKLDEAVRPNLGSRILNSRVGVSVTGGVILLLVGSAVAAYTASDKSVARADAAEKQAQISCAERRQLRQISLDSLQYQRDFTINSLVRSPGQKRYVEAYYDKQIAQLPTVNC